MEQMNSNYLTNVMTAIAANPSFKSICDYNIQNFPADGYAKYYSQLGNGTAILDTPEQLNTYMASYGDMHMHKLIHAYDSLFNKESFNGKSVEIVDWGCGQAFASCVLIDYIKNNAVGTDLSKFILIEPSSAAIKRGLDHIDAIYQRKPKPVSHLINHRADSELQIRNLQTKDKIKIHLFSNILDMENLDLSIVFKNVMKNFEGTNYFVCVSPIRGGRLISFFNLFDKPQLVSTNGSNMVTEIFRPSAMRKVTKSISRVEYIFKTNL